MKKNSFVEGTVVAYIMILITKILGAIYVIPLYNLIGTDGGILYSYAYNVYNLFLNISISGIPTAVAIIVAEYNTLKMFNDREKTYHLANKIIGIISIICFVLMFVFAKYIGLFFVGDLEDGTDINSIILVVRSISFCLLIIPFLSVLRGYLQGNKYLNDSSYSQLIEQVVRIVLVLLGAYITINILHYKTDIGVSVALLGTFMGGLVAYLFLRYRLSKSKIKLKEGVTSIKNATDNDKKIIKKIVFYSIPIIIVSVTQNIYEIADMKLIIKGLYMVGYTATESEYYASVIVTWAPKICMIINALATGLCTSIIPFIVSSYTEKDYKGLSKRFSQALNIIIAISIPLSIYIIIFRSQVFRIFYGESDGGYLILSIIALISILFSLQLVINMILQGMKKFKVVYINTITGIVINIILDIPIILLLYKIGLPPYIGSILATVIGLTISEFIVILYLRKEFKFRYRSIFNTSIKTVFATSIMAIILILLKYVVFTGPDRFIILFIKLALLGVLGISIYILISYKLGLVDEVFGENFFNKVLSKLKIGKKNYDE